LFEQFFIYQFFYCIFLFEVILYTEWKTWSRVNS